MVPNIKPVPIFGPPDRSCNSCLETSIQRPRSKQGRARQDIPTLPSEAASLFPARFPSGQHECDDAASDDKLSAADDGSGCGDRAGAGGDGLADLLAAV